MAVMRRPAKGAFVAVVVAGLAGIFGLGVSPQLASAAAPTQGTVTITQSCYDVGLGTILAVLTSPVGPVSGSMSVSATSPTGMAYGGQVAVAGSKAAIYHVYPGSYAVRLSAQDAQGTTYNFTGTMVVPTCENSIVGIQAEPDPDGGYAVYANGAAVLSNGPNHASDTPSFLVTQPHAPIVGMGALYSPASGAGYIFAAADGGVYADNAPFYGSAAGLTLHAPIVAMALTPDNGGYWLVGSDGGVFAFGDARYYGSMAGQTLNQPVVGLSVDEATGGYWLVGRDGAVYAFNAPFDGSAAAGRLNAPIVAMESAPNGAGYRLVGADGGVFSFNQPFYGSMAGRPLTGPVVGIAADPLTGGYWLASSNGGVFAYNAPFYGVNGVSPG